MNLGKPIKVVNIPEHAPVRRPVTAPPPAQPDPLIPLPAEWPMYEPPQRPQPDGRVSR
jgi:hypothetical protein